MDELVGLYRQALEGFGARVAAVRDDQWERPTPCADWSVRQLVNHVVGENAWAVPLLAGRTIADVGDQLDGDLLGADPVAAWQYTASPAVAAASADGALERTVHVSFGDISGREYLSQITTDHVVHAWDLARGAGGDEALDPELVAFAYEYIEPQVEGWRAAGAFGPSVDVPKSASLQDRLLGLTGRQP
ncbi:MAG: TIGR03086 family metal-binding protein [Acidimicrobiales bacterium]